MALNRIVCFAACLGLTFALAGCGGGGNSSSGNNNNSGGGGSTACTTPAGFSDNAGADQNVKTGARVQLDGTASHGAGGAAPASYQWSFTARPNGSSATLSSARSAAPQFTADQPGQYVVKLVIDGKNQCAAQTDSVTVTATPPGSNAVPTANAGTDQSVIVGASVVLSGARSFDPDGNTLTYAWQFVSRPDGSSASLADANTVSPSFTADQAGTYVVGLRVNDGSATSAQDTVTVVAAASGNARPLADAGPDQAVTVNSIVRLNGSASRDPENRLLTYHWHFVSKPSASSAAITGPDTAEPVFQPDVAGTYVASLTVTAGSDTSLPDTVIVSASKPNVPPTADAGPDQNVIAGVLVHLDGTASSDPNGDTLNYHWTFVSMPAGSQTALTGAASATPAFTPDQSGQYVVELVVDDGQAQSTPDTVVITASAGNSAPVADAGSDRNVAVGSQVQLDGSNSSDANNDALTYQWILISRPAGSTAALSSADTATPSFTADVVGFYVLALQVNDGQADSALDLLVITASPTLALYVNQNGGYQSAGGSGQTATIQVPVDGQDVLLDNFRVKALSSDFTITNVQTTSATTPKGPIVPYFHGLSQGDQIAAGDQLDFATQLYSVPNAPGQYQVKLQFTASPSGKTYRFTYNVTIP